MNNPIIGVITVPECLRFCPTNQVSFFSSIRLKILKKELPDYLKEILNSLTVNNLKSRILRTSVDKGSIEFSIFSRCLSEVMLRQDYFLPANPSKKPFSDRISNTIISFWKSRIFSFQIPSLKNRPLWLLQDILSGLSLTFPAQLFLFPHILSLWTAR